MIILSLSFFPIIIHSHFLKPVISSFLQILLLSDPYEFLFRANLPEWKSLLIFFLYILVRAISMIDFSGEELFYLPLRFRFSDSFMLFSKRKSPSLYSRHFLQ